MYLQFVGCGDAFGSGGRFNTCFHLTGAATSLLIDCGATTPVALKRLGLDANTIDAILVTHFHADHFGGIPFLLLEAQMVGKRTRPLTLMGPPGLPARYARAMETAFPGAPQQPAAFALTLREIAAGETAALGALAVTAFPVVHTEAAGPCLGYRIAAGGKVLAYSGDTEWTEALVEIGRDADLFVCEAYTYDRKVRHHTDLVTLEAHLSAIRPKRLVLTHMSADMLAQRGSVRHETAQDGLTIAF